MLLDILKNPVVLAIIAYVAITLLTGGKLDFTKIMEMIERVINPAKAFAKMQAKAAQDEIDNAVADIQDAEAAGDEEAETLARRRFDRLTKRKTK